MRLVRRQHAASRKGLSLLEVLAALAIFFFTAVALTQMVDSASRAAMRARRLTKAQLLAETKMDEITSGALELSNASGTIEEELEGWTYTIAVTPESWSSVTDTSGASVTGLNTVVVTVNWSGSGGLPVEFSLARMVLDPSLRLPQPPPQTTPSTSTTGSQ
jgi:general secretion pathway protein I